MVLIIPDDILRMVASEIYGGDYELHFNNCINQDSESARRFNELFSVLNDPDSLLESGSALFSFLEFLVRYHSTCSFPTNDKQSAGIVKIAEEYINQNFREQITLEDLSEIAGVSPFHLNRTFTAVTGISPHSYQIHRRIEFSKRLLIEGNSIAYVSAESGFTDQSHYTRFFKKITGTTPGRFLLFNRENSVQK
jgi:AraC-like DNA-binding protein